MHGNFRADIKPQRFPRSQTHAVEDAAALGQNDCDVPSDSAAAPTANATSDTWSAGDQESGIASNTVSASPNDTASDSASSAEKERERADRSQMDKAEFAHLVDRVNAGDGQALQELRRLLDTCPDIWQRVGDLAAHAELSLMRVVAGGNRLLLESLQRKADAMKVELSRPGASALENLAAQRVVACWLQLQHADAVCSTPDLTLPQGKFWALEQDRAHRRYLSAVKQLTTLRQLLPLDAQTDLESASGATEAAPGTKSTKTNNTRDITGPSQPLPDQREDEPEREGILPFCGAAARASSPGSASS